MDADQQRAETIEQMKTLIQRFGGQSDRLREVRSHYHLLQICPGDPMALVLLMKAVETCQQQGEDKPSC